MHHPLKLPTEVRNFISSLTLSVLKSITLAGTRQFMVLTLLVIMTIATFVLRPISWYLAEINHEGGRWAIWMTSGYFSFWGNIVGLVVLWSYKLAPQAPLSSANSRAVATTCMLIVFLISFFFPVVEKSAFDWVRGTLHHRIAPILYVLFFLMLADGRTTKKAILFACLVPLIYFLITFTRGLVRPSYPYFFVNTPYIGWSMQVLVGVVFVVLFGAICASLVLLDKAIQRVGELPKHFLREAKLVAQDAIRRTIR